METKGITIEFYGKSIELQNTIDDINKGLKATREELSTVNKELKLDPSNVEKLSQKMKLLQQQEKLLTEQAELYKQELSKLDKEDIGGEKWTGLKKKLDNTEKSLLKCKQSIEKIDGKNIDGVTEKTKKMDKSFQDAGSGAIKLGDLIKANIISQAVIEGVKKLAGVVKEVAQELHSFAEDYREMEVYEKQFESNIKNTADASDEQIASLKKLAKQKQKEGVISDRAITSAYQELATYVESTDAIEGLTDALVDMAAQQYGVDASADSVRNLATTLGKALANGDYSGLTRLGYGFTEAQQKIMEYGSELERVQVINDVISSSIGGMNEALAQTDAGKVFSIKSAFDEVKNSLGGIASEIELAFGEEFMNTVMPDIESFVQYIIDNKDKIMEFVTFVADTLKDAYTEVKDLLPLLNDALGDFDLMKETILLIKQGFDLVLGVVEIFLNLIKQIRDIFASDFWKNGLNFGNIFDLSPWQSGGNMAPRGNQYAQSGGMMSGSITLNNTFSITSNNVTDAMVKGWANILTEQINENLGRLV